MAIDEHNFEDDHTVADPLVGDDIKWDVHSDYTEEKQRKVEADKDVSSENIYTGQMIIN